MSYFGGKAQDGVYQAIINQIPMHDRYIELFLGGGAIMLKKKPALESIGVEIEENAFLSFPWDIPAKPTIIQQCVFEFLSTTGKNLFTGAGIIKFTYMVPEMKKITPSQKLVIKIRELLPEIIISEFGYIRRCYPGCNLLSHGAWSWTVMHDGNSNIGSQWTVRDCLKSKKLSYLVNCGDIEIIPEDNKHGL